MILQILAALFLFFVVGPLLLAALVDDFVGTMGFIAALAIAYAILC